MLYAIVSDIHANLPAWKAVLKDIRANGADAILCLGDIVGYGPMPLPVLEDVHANAAQIVLGNHDAVVCGRFDISSFVENARAVIEWTHNQLGDEAVRFFSELPTDIEGDDFVVAHAELGSPERFAYVEDDAIARESFAACDSTMIFVGHTHHALIHIFDPADNQIHVHPAADFEAAPGMRYIVNVGSVGDPRDRGDIRACYVLYQSDTREVTYRRVPFDLGAYRLSLNQSGLHIYPYFLSSVDGHPDVIQTQDWKPRISLVRQAAARPPRIQLSRGIFTNKDVLELAAAEEQKRREQATLNEQARLAEERRVELMRRQKIFTAISRSASESAREEKRKVAEKLRTMQQAALARRKQQEQH